MNDKLAKIKAYVENKMYTLGAEIDEIDERFEDGFDPMDWSGGNFDDAYSIGEEDGDTRGAYRVLSKIKRILEEETE